MPDARTERWAEHRVEMRRQLVDAAVRAIERVGPQVSMREIAAEANIPKPSIYRFFKDKSALASAIADQAREDIIQQLVIAREQAPGTLGGLIHAALVGYSSLIVEYPNVGKFLFFGTDTPGVKTLENSRVIAREVAALIEIIIEASGGAKNDVMLYASMVVGAVTCAGDWWLNTTEPVKPVHEFVARVEPAVRSVIQLAAGVTVDFEMPLADAPSGAAPAS